MPVSVYVQILRRKWPAVICITVAAIILGSSYSFLTPIQYTSSTRAYVSTRSVNGISELASAADYSPQAASNLASIADSALVVSPVLRRLGYSESSTSVEGNISAIAAVGTPVITVTVRDASPSRAARIANAVAMQLETAAVAVTPTTRTTDAALKVTIVQPAVVALAPTSPDTAANLLTSAALGLLLGCALVILMDRSRRSLRNLDEN